MLCLPLTEADQVNCWEADLLLICMNTICAYERISEHIGTCLRHTNIETQVQMVYCSFPYKVFFFFLFSDLWELTGKGNWRSSASFLLRKDKRTRGKLFQLFCVHSGFFFWAHLENQYEYYLFFFVSGVT